LEPAQLKTVPDMFLRSIGAVDTACKRLAVF